MLTEENLDDWIAQSLNRSIASMLNPQKKFYLPVSRILVRIIIKRRSRRGIGKRFLQRNMKTKVILSESRG
jgi:hypothetical protein